MVAKEQKNTESFPADDSKSLSQPNIPITDFEFTKKLGSGAFSKVYMATHIPSGAEVAIKVIIKSLLNEKVARAANRKQKLRAERLEKETRRINKQQTNISNELNQNLQLKIDSLPKRFSNEECKPLDSYGSSNINILKKDLRQNEEITSHFRRRPTLAPLKIDVANSRMSLSDIISPISVLQPHPLFCDTIEQRIAGEARLMMRLQHPNISKIYQVVDTPSECYIIMELAGGGELMEYININGKLSENEARRLFRQLISAVDHIHQSNVVHRDIKMENILLTADLNIRLTDFGLGRTFRNTEDELMETFCGTPNFAASELITFTPYFGPKVDIWALGVILYIMCTGKAPFVGHTISSLYNRINNLIYNFPPGLSREFMDLIKKIFVINPKDRISIEEIFKHPWVNHGYQQPPLRVLPKYLTLEETGSDRIVEQKVSDTDLIVSFKEFEDLIRSCQKRGNQICATSPVKRNQYIYAANSLLTPDSSIDKAGFKGGIKTPFYSPIVEVFPSDHEYSEIKEQQKIDVNPIDFQSMLQEMSYFPLSDAILYEMVVIEYMKGTDNLPNSKVPLAPSLKITEEFHRIHRPCQEIRSARFSLSSRTIFDKNSATMFLIAHYALVIIKRAWFPNLEYDRPGEKYIFRVELVPNSQTLLVSNYAAFLEQPRSIKSEEHAKNQSNEKLIFQIEVCKTWLLSLHGFKITRIQGDTQIFKNLQMCFAQLINLK